MAAADITSERHGYEMQETMGEMGHGQNSHTSSTLADMAMTLDSLGLDEGEMGAPLVGDPDSGWWFEGGDEAWGMLMNNNLVNFPPRTRGWQTAYFSGLGIAVPTAFWGATPALERA